VDVAHDGCVLSHLVREVHRLPCRFQRHLCRLLCSSWRPCRQKSFGNAWRIEMRWTQYRMRTRYTILFRVLAFEVNDMQRWFFSRLSNHSTLPVPHVNDLFLTMTGQTTLRFMTGLPNQSQITIPVHSTMYNISVDSQTKKTIPEIISISQITFVQLSNSPWINPFLVSHFSTCSLASTIQCMYSYCPNAISGQQPICQFSTARRRYIYIYIYQETWAGVIFGRCPPQTQLNTLA
jgi:hypothetical protein